MLLNRVHMTHLVKLYLAPSQGRQSVVQKSVGGESGELSSGPFLDPLSSTMRTCSLCPIGPPDCPFPQQT